MPTSISNGFRDPLGDGQLTRAIDGDGYYVAQDFNVRNAAVSNSYHLGVDWNGEGGGNSDLGDPVYAVSNGQVTQAGFSDALGNYLVIRHDLPAPIVVNGSNTSTIVSLYAHLQYLPTVREDDIVSIGQQVGRLGSSGDAGDFAHLHFEIRLGIGSGFQDPNGYNPSGAPAGWTDPVAFINQHRSIGAVGTPGAMDDYAAHANTAGTIALGGQISGSIEVVGDRDWFRIHVNQGGVYSVDVISGSSTQAGAALSDPEAYLYNSSSQLIASNDDYQGLGLNSRITFTATYTGFYFIGVGEHGDNATGSYHLTAILESSVQSADDFASNTGTAGRISQGGMALGTVGVEGDRDWFRIDLVEGYTYTVDLIGGAVPQVGPFLNDPTLYLRNLNGDELQRNDDFSGSLNSSITFTANYSGQYFLDAGGFGDSVGTYRLSVSSGLPPPGGTSSGAGPASDNLPGSSGRDTISGLGGDDTIDGGAGDDYLRGNEGDDSLTGGSGFDDLHGNQGNDTVRGGEGPDWVVGGQSNDMLFGDAGDDVVYGNLGADTQDGGDGRDWVRGGQGNDSLRGGVGDDWMSGDLGDDTISGGAGADIFHTWGAAGIDRITDFSLAEGDRVQLDPQTSYTLTQVGADTVINMVGGAQMWLVGVNSSSLTGGWIFT